MNNSGVVNVFDSFENRAHEAGGITGGSVFIEIRDASLMEKGDNITDAS